jgi:hypothetical protein
VLGVAAATVFVVALGGITGLESVLGKPLSALFGHGHDARSSVGQLFDGGSASSPSRPAPGTTHPGSTPTGTTPTASPSGPPSSAPPTTPAATSAPTTAAPPATPTVPAPGEATPSP